MMLRNDNRIKVTIDERRVEHVAKYKYLANILNNCGTLEEKLSKKIKMVRRVYDALNKYFLNNRQITTKTTVHIYYHIPRQATMRFEYYLKSIKIDYRRQR